MGKRSGNRGGKRGSRSSIASQAGPDEVDDYLEAEAEVTYEHSVALGRPDDPPPAEILAGRHGADMPETLEMATWVMREQVRGYWDAIRERGELNKRERAEFNQLVDALGKLDRSVRQWRKLQAEELGSLSDLELEALLPIAAKALGLSAPIDVVPEDEEE